MEYNWPKEYELLEFFECDPIESNPSDGFWCYEKIFDGGLAFTFSFNTHECSIQTNMSLNGETFSTVCHEGAQGLSLDDKSKTLSAVFEDSSYVRELKIQIAPKCSVSWSSLAK